MHATYQQGVTPVLSPGSNSAPASIKDTQLLLQDSLTPFHQGLECSATFCDALQISLPPLQLSQHILKQVQPLKLHWSQTQGKVIFTSTGNKYIVGELHLWKELHHV